MRFMASVKNTASSIIMQLVVMLVGLILPRLYLVAFGSEINGLVISITQFISYFSLVEAGLASAVTAALYLPLAEKKEKKLSSIIVAARDYYFYIGYIFSGLVIGLSIIYPIFINVESLSSFEIALLVVVLGFNGSLDFFTLSKYRALLTADQRYYVIANASTFAYIINFLLVYVCIKLSFDILTVRLVALSSYVLRSLILLFYVRKNYKWIDYSLSPNNDALNKRWDAMLLQFLGLVQTAMPVVLLTFLTKDLKIVSVYSIYNMVASSIIALLASLTNGFAAPLGDMLVKNESDNLKKTYTQYEFIFYSVMIWSYSCMSVLYIPFIKIYTHGINDIEYIHPMIALLFVLNGIAYNFKTPAGTLIGAAGLFNETRTATIVQSIIAIVFSIALIPKWGILGALIALIISNLYRDVELIIFMSRNVTKTSIRTTFKRMIYCIAILILSNLPFLFIDINTADLFTWFVNAIMVGLWCLFVLLLFNIIFDKNILYCILNRISQSIKIREKI